LRTVIRNGYVFEGNAAVKKDIVIEDGYIYGVLDGNSAEFDGLRDEMLDAEGKYVLPGFIDMNCSICDPGYENKEDIFSISRSAIKGGFTSVACQPNTDPVIDDKTVVNYILTKDRRLSKINIFPYGSMTKKLMGSEIVEIGEMKKAGIVALSDGGLAVQNADILRNIMIYSSMFDLPVITACEDFRLSADGVMNKGAHATRIGLKGIPLEAEETMVARNIILSKHTGVKLHIANVSTKGSVELIRGAKKSGVKITCETCPHYFTLTEEAVGDYNTYAKVRPPLRTANDMESLIGGLADGTIDVISTGHSPATTDSKSVEFDRAAFGISSMETAFSLCYTSLVKTGVLSLPELADKMSLMPAKILGLGDKGEIRENYEADLIIADVGASYVIRGGSFSSKAKYTPYEGTEVSGVVYATFVGGRLVYLEENL